MKYHGAYLDAAYVAEKEEYMPGAGGSQRFVVKEEKRVFETV